MKKNFIGIGLGVLLNMGLMYFLYVRIFRRGSSWYTNEGMAKRIVTENGNKVRVGRIVHTNKVLGTGAAGTVVYEGLL